MRAAMLALTSSWDARGGTASVASEMSIEENHQSITNHDVSASAARSAEQF